MSQNLDEVEFTIFDTETTGLDASCGDRIVEIAGIRFQGKEKKATFQSLINSKRPVSEAAFLVNQITPLMLAGAPSSEIVIPKFLDFIQKSCLCSYNAAFDLEFLNSELKLMGRHALEGTVAVDILKMARRLLPGLERYALWFVADKLGISTRQRHRAFSDAELTLEVFYRLRERLKTKGISDFVSFLSLFGINSVFVDTINNQKIAQIQEAINLGVKLRIKYLSSYNAEVSERDIIPKEIRQERSRFYLMSHCCLKNEERSFRIDGILHIEII